MLHPEKQEKLYNELIDLYPNKEINYEQLKEANYLDAVLKESQRLYPAFNFIFRIAENAIEIKGLKIRANDAIGIDLLSLHYDKEFWGEDVKKFKPERFLDKDIKFENDDSMHFLPFGSGPRSCVAIRMASVQSKFVLAQLILNYQIYRSTHTDVPPKLVKSPQNRTFKELKLGFKKRCD